MLSKLSPYTKHFLHLVPPRLKPAQKSNDQIREKAAMNELRKRRRNSFGRKAGAYPVGGGLSGRPGIHPRHNRRRHQTGIYPLRYAFQAFARNKPFSATCSTPTQTSPKNKTIRYTVKPRRMRHRLPYLRSADGWQDR